MPDSLEWSQVVETARRSGAEAYLATVDSHGMPHIAVIAPGFGDERVWIATNHGSAKARNIAGHNAVALHWPVLDGVDLQVLVRGTAGLLEGAAKARAWEARYFEWDVGQWYDGPDDPKLAIVEVTPHSAIVDKAHGGAVGRWRRDG